MKRGALVLFHLHRGEAIGSLIRRQDHAPQKSVRGRNKTPAERAVLIALVFLARNLLVRRVLEYYGESGPGQDLILIRGRILCQTNPLVLDRLTGSIQRAIREEHGFLRGAGRCLRLTHTILRFTEHPVPRGLGTYQKLACISIIGEVEYTMLIRVCRTNLVMATGRVVVQPRTHPGSVNGHSCARVENEPVHRTVSGDLSRDQGQVADEYRHKTQLVVRFRKGRAMARDHVIGPLGQVLGHGYEFCSLTVVERFGQIRLPLNRRLFSEETSPLRSAEVVFVQGPSCQRIKRHGSEIDPVHISVRHLDLGPGRVPHAFGLDRHGLALNLPDQVVTQDSAVRGRIRVPRLGRQGMGLEKITPGLQHAGPFVQGLGHGLEPAPLPRIVLQCSCVGLVLFRANGHIVRKLEPVQVCVHERGGILVLFMEDQQVLVQANGPELGRILLCGLGLPCHELGPRGKNGTVHHDLKIILRPVGALFACCVKGEGLIHQKIVQRGTHGIRYIAPFNQVIIRGNGNGLECLIICQCHQKMCVNLSQNPGQTPGSKIVTRRL